MLGAASLVVEAQGDGVERKRWVWPLYVASPLAQRRRPTWLIVLARDEATARRSRQPIEAFQGGTFAPIVIGPSDLPRITDVDEAVRRPELAILSALAHARGPHALEVGVAALFAGEAIRRRDDARGMLCVDAVLDALGELAKHALEAIMTSESRTEWKSEFARHWVDVGREEGREEGRVATVRRLCESLGIAWSDERGRDVAALDDAALGALLRALAETRRWPE